MAILASIIAWELGGLGKRSVAEAFALQDTAGRTVTDRDLRGRWSLIYFGYTSCPDVCPLALHDMVTALDQLAPATAARVQPVFVTVDPERDTPAVLRRYAAAADSRLLALTGSDSAVAATLRAFHVERDVRHLSGRPPGDYLMDHTSVLFLLGPDGRFVTVMRADETPERIAADLRAHVS